MVTAYVALVYCAVETEPRLQPRIGEWRNHEPLTREHSCCRQRPAAPAVANTHDWGYLRGSVLSEPRTSAIGEELQTAVLDALVPRPRPRMRDRYIDRQTDRQTEKRTA
eukprot:scaffold122884_cov69-Phaeocystis_antarctica.AAC.1